MFVLMTILILSLVGLATVAVILGILWLARPPRDGATWRRTEEQRFPTGQTRTVEIINPVGSVEVHGEESDEIAIHVQIVADGETEAVAQQRAEQVRLHMTTAGERLLLAADQLPQPARDGVQVHWLVRVPPTLALRADNSVGPVSLTGLRGPADVTTATGEIRATRAALATPTTLRTSTGQIRWQGALGSAQGRYEVTTSVGEVTIILPADSTFALAAQSSLGTIQSDFPLGAAEPADAVGQSLQGQVGEEGPSLAVHTTTGNIVIASDGAAPLPTAGNDG